jgi:hypothetical protein
LALHALSEAVDAMLNDGREVIEISDGENEFLVDEVMGPVDIDGRSKAACREIVLKIFPDIDIEYLETLAEEKAFDHEAVVTAIVDQFIEPGKPIPKRQRVNLKRKRESDDVGDRWEDLKKKYDNDDWRTKRKDHGYRIIT